MPAGSVRSDSRAGRAYPRHFAPRNCCGPLNPTGPVMILGYTPANAVQPPSTKQPRRGQWLSTLLFALAALVPAPGLAGALYADLDRDGVRDEVTIQNGPRTGLRVWLSGSRSALILPTRHPVLGIAASDVDGDGDLDLIASDTSAKLHVWHTSHRGGLRRTRPHRRPSAAGIWNSSGVTPGSDQPTNAALPNGGSVPTADHSHPESLVPGHRTGRVHAAAGHRVASGHAHPSRPRGPPFG